MSVTHLPNTLSRGRGHRWTGSVASFPVGLVALLVAAVSWYWVWSAPTPRVVAEVGSADAFRCEPPSDVYGYEMTVGQPPWVPRPVAGTVPDDFFPVEAVVCDVGTDSMIDAHRMATYNEVHYAGDLAPAVEQFNASSDRRTLFTGYCASYSAAMMPVMWLLDKDGRTVQPTLPAADCGLSDMGGLIAVQDLPVVEKIEHRVRITDDGVVQMRGCSPIFHAPVAGSRRLEAYTFSFGGLCHFGFDATEWQFRGAADYPFDAKKTMNEIVEGLDVAGPCSESATTVVTTIANEFAGGAEEPTSVLVELDGCRRLIADGYVPLGPLSDDDARQLAQ